ncbi:hypothetical protein CsNV_063 [Callinectes sapidus nudivirus]|nr:hypothetical protein CsNV_063 [Callinectes sapidus nudivirus]
MTSISNHVNAWVDHKCYRYNDTLYISDLHFEEFFGVDNIEGLVSTTFEVLEGLYGFERNIFYDDLKFTDDPLFIDYDTGEISILSNSQCNDIITLKKYKLSLFSPDYMITTSYYLKPICSLLFSTYKTVEGVNYVCNNLVEIISSILPQFIFIKKPIDKDSISIPFSFSFIQNVNQLKNVKFIHSQVDNRTYKLCPKEK